MVGEIIFDVPIVTHLAEAGTQEKEESNDCRRTMLSFKSLIFL